jgi:hypothetical protein
MKKIVFNNIPGAARNKAWMPNDYEGLNWENFAYVEESYAQSHFVSAWKNVFKYSRYGIYNADSAQTMYIRSNKPGRTFTLVNMDATVIDRSGAKWNMAGFKNNVKVYSQQIEFSNAGEYKLLELKYADIDEIKFTTFYDYPVLFIGCLNIIM